MAIIKRKTKRATPDLMRTLKGTTQNVDLTEFKDSVLSLFSDIMNEDDIAPEMRRKVASLRARIEIELKEL